MFGAIDRESLLGDAERTGLVLYGFSVAIGCGLLSVVEIILVRRDIAVTFFSMYPVNGQTGKVGGSAPVSAWRVILAILIAAGIITGLYFLLR